MLQAKTIIHRRASVSPEKLLTDDDTSSSFQCYCAPAYYTKVSLAFFKNVIFSALIVTFSYKFDFYVEMH